MTTLEIIFAIIALLFTFFGGVWGVFTLVAKRNENILVNDVLFKEQQSRNTEDIKKASTEIETFKKDFKSEVEQLKKELKTDVDSLKKEIKTDVDVLKKFEREQSVINEGFKKDINLIMISLNDIQIGIKEIKNYITKGMGL